MDQLSRVSPSIFAPSQPSDLIEAREIIYKGIRVGIYTSLGLLGETERGRRHHPWIGNCTKRETGSQERLLMSL